MGGPIAGRRVLIAGLFHETHTFLDEVTTAPAFRFWVGDELLSLAGDASPLGGVLEFARQRSWHVLPGVWAMAVPSGTVADEVFEMYWDRLGDQLRRLVRDRVDAVYLVLHGAMVCRGIGDTEGELLRRLRAVPELARVPIYGVLDLHANVSADMIRLSNCLVAYRENPHADARQSAVRAARLLEEHLRDGVEPQQSLRPLPIVWPPTGTASARDPMASLLRLARELEASDPSLACINVVPGFSFADTADTGVSLSVVSTAGEGRATEALDRLDKRARELAPLGVTRDAELDETLLSWKRAPPQGLTVIAEPADNIGGGAPGDGTGLLRGLIRHGIDRCAVCLNDPVAAEALARHPIGADVSLALGGRGSSLDPGPLELDYRLIGLCDGAFELEDKQSHLASVVGDRFDMGRCAVIEHQGVTILVTSRRTPPMDLGQWRCVGLSPESFSILGVKAAVAHRRTYDPIAAHHLNVATPGPCASDLTQFPFKNLRRPIYPLDAISGIGGAPVR